MPPSRSTVLRSLRAEELADLFGRAPDVAAVLRSGAVRGSPQGAAGDVGAVADLLARRPSIYSVVASLDRFHLQLLTLAAWHGGALRHDQAVAEVGEGRAGALKPARALLERLLLVTHSGREWLTLRPGVADVVGVPGPRVRTALAGLPPGRLADVLRLLGERPPASKEARLDLVESTLRDPHRIRDLIAAMPGDVAELFTGLLEHGAGAYAELDPDWDVVDWLVDRSLIGFDVYGDTPAIFSDITVGLHGHLFCHWPSAPDLDPQPLAATPAALPPVLATFDRLLVAIELDPPAALVAGGLGARAVKTLATTIGQPIGTAGQLTALARDLGLVAETVTDPGRATGRGQNRRVVGQQRAWTTTGLAQRWRTAPAAERWLRLVHAWRDTTEFSEADGLPEKLAGLDQEAQAAAWAAPADRAALLDLLLGLPAGTGTSASALAEAADFLRPSQFRGRRVDGEITALRALGLVPGDGPIGLTATARTLLAEGHGAVAALLPPPRRTITVQADRTVLATPDLAADLTARLERYGEREGDALLRLTEARVAAALDAGDTAEAIAEFLAEHATAEVPQPVRYWLDDLARSHGRLRAGGALTYLRCDDPALLARAATVKAAGLRVLAPTVAVTALPRDKLLVALRAKGLMPVAEAADGTAIPVRAAAAAPSPVADLPPLPGPDQRDRDKDLLDLARTILA